MSEESKYKEINTDNEILKNNQYTHTSEIIKTKPKCNKGEKPIDNRLKKR
jgi:hypothetical protein